MKPIQHSGTRLLSLFLSLVMVLSLIPAMSTPTAAAQTSYANEPNWYDIKKEGGNTADDRMETLSILLRHQKDKPEENVKNEIPESFDEIGYFDQYYVGDTLYIRLQADIDVKVYPYSGHDSAEAKLEFSTGHWKYKLPVYGNKVLDLNGHKIKVQQDGDGHQAKGAVFMIKDGATLTVVDSKGGGKMIANSWIKMYLDLFWVENGGELILNAPGATFESGYSEKVWLTNAYKENEKPDNAYDVGYNGYARNQASGTAVTVFGGGKLTVSGGTVKGRGHDQISQYGTDTPFGELPLRKCAAINAYPNSTVHIIDGNFYGMGGADALKINENAWLTIESGVFDTYKVDKIVLPKADRDGANVGEIAGQMFAGMFGWMISLFEEDKLDNYMDGEYGYIGIPTDKLAQLSAKGSAVEVITGDHDVSGDELSNEETTPSTKNTTKRVTIRPKTGSATADSRVTIEPANGSYRWSPYGGDTTLIAKNDSFEVNVSFNERYFSEDARELAANYYRERKGQGYGFNDKDKEYYLNYRFTLYERGGKKVAFLGEKRLPASSTSFPADLTKLPDLSSSGKETYAFDITKWQELDSGKYTVRCEVVEVWKGEHNYKSAWFADMPLTIRKASSREDMMTALTNNKDFKPDFDINHTWCRGVIDGVPVMSLILTDETQAALKKAAGEASDKANYDDVTVTYELWDYDPDGNTFEKMSQTVKANEYTTLTSATSGAKVITASIGIPYYVAGELKGYDHIEVSKNFLLLPPVYQDGTEFGYDKAVEVSEGKPATISFNGVSNSNVADLHAKGSFGWDWYFFAGGHDMYEGDALTADNGYTKFSTATGLKGSSIEMELDGTYRLVCTYQPDKYGSPTQTFTSAPVDVVSTNTERVMLTLTGPEYPLGGIYTDEAKLELNCTGKTEEIESVQFSVKGRPDGVAYSTPIKIENTSGKRTKYVVNMQQFTGIRDAEDPSGEYTFRVFATCKVDGVYPTYRVYSNDVTVTIERAADGYALYANGQYLGEGQTSVDAAKAQAVPIYLDSTTSTVTLSTKYFPTNATYDQRFTGEDDIHYLWFVSEGSANISLPNDENHRVGHSVEATIKRPGTAYIVCQKWANANTYSNADVNKRTTTVFKVCVPVTKVEFWQPDYQLNTDLYYRNILPDVTAYATCGASISRNAAFDFSYSDESSLNYAPVYLDNGTSSVPDKTVAANDKGSVIYKLHLADGLSYPLKKENGTDYVVDTSAVKLTVRTADGDVTKTADKWGVSDANSVFSTGSVSPKPNQAYFQLTQDVFVKDRGAQYIDLVVISTTEPRVGDPINENIVTYWAGGAEKEAVYAEYGQAAKAAEVFSYSNVKASNGTPIILPGHSYVSKATITAGAPYTDAEGAEQPTDQSSWTSSTFLNGKYENGTYIHELQLYTNSNATENGTKYYFAPDCKIIMNGNLLDFGDRTMYNGGYSYLTFKYFYDVGTVNRVDVLDLTSIQPQQGNQPAEPANVTVTGFEYPSGGSKTANSAKIDVTKLIWFVDKNSNGQLDAGEEVKTEWTTTTNAEGKKEITGYDAANSTLWWDGTFLGGVEYSALVEIAAGDSATRFGENIEVNCDGKAITLTGGQKSFVVKFPADHTIHTIHLPIPTGEAAANPDRDPLGLFNASNQGYKAEVSKVHQHRPDKDGASTLNYNISNFYEGGTDLKNETLTKGKYWMILDFSSQNGCKFADDVKVLINGVDTGEFGYGKEQVKELFVVRYNTNSASVWRTFEVPEISAKGVTVSGTVTSFGSATDDVTIQLIESGTSEAAYEAVVQGNSAAYAINNVPAGTYTVKVMKKNHVTREYTLTVSDSNVTQDAKICLLGDVNGDGAIKMVDYIKARQHAQKSSYLSGYELACADVTGDGEVKMIDYIKIRQHAQKVTLLW